MMRWIYTTICFFLLAPVMATGEDTVAIKYAESISTDDLSKHLHVLASDEYEGRETGEKGQKMSAKYIAEFFKSVGIPGIQQSDNYFQEFPLVIQDPMGVKIVNNKKDYVFLEDFYYFPGFNDDVIKANEVLFLGYGIDADDYSDYKGVDVAGKVALILDGEPIDKKGNSIITKKEMFSSWSMNFRTKLSKAKEEKLAALFIVVENIDERINQVRHYVSQPGMKLAGNGDEQSGENLPVFYISNDMAEAMFNESKYSLEKVRKKIDKKGKPLSTSLPNALELNIDRVGKEIVAENVLGYIEGSDLKEEIVVVTAHYDHIGMHDDKVYNGADDDGSGTVAVMELAEAFAMAKASGNGPRRSVLFMPVSGEEKGLLGSQYYVEHPVYPLENTVANLNIDMIGRMDDKHEGNPDYVYLIGSDRLSTELHEVSENANKVYTNLELDYTFNSPKDPNRFYYRSDHYNFAKNNIPVIFYFNGTHEDYHQHTDTVDKINFDKIKKITQLIFYTTWDLANRDQRVKVDKQD